MAGKSIGNVYAELSVRDKMTVGLRRAGRALSKFGASSARMAGAGLAVGVTAASAALIAGTKHTITAGAELDHLSTQTGLAVSSLMRLGQAYKDNGKDAKGVGKDIGKMQKAIFEQATNPSSTIDYFAELGLSAKDLMDLSPEEQFFTIGKAIAGIENDTQRAAAAMGIFGKSGASLITVFKGSNLDDVNKSLGRMPELMQQYSKELERVDTLMGRLPNKANQFFTGFTVGVIGQMLPALEKMNEQDFTTMGEKLGKVLGDAFRDIKSGDMWKVFGLNALASVIETGIMLSEYLTRGIDIAVEYMSNAFKGAGSSIVDGIVSALGSDTISKQWQDMQMVAELERQSESEKNPAKTFDGITGKNAMSDGMRAMADQIQLDAAMKQDQLSKDGLSEPPWVDVVAKAASPEAQQKTASWESSNAQVSDLQSRGFSYGREGTVNLVKEQANNIKNLYELMREAVKKGDVIFTGA